MHIEYLNELFLLLLLYTNESVIKKWQSEVYHVFIFAVEG